MTGGLIDNREIAVSIVAPCRNERAQIEPFLRSVSGQDFGELTHEMLIADGMSSDGTRQILFDFAAHHPEVRIIDNPSGLTSAGLNRGIRAARGEFIVRMDVHTVYAADYVRTCVETLLNKRVDNVGGPARTHAAGYLGKAIAGAYHSRFSCGGARFHVADYEGPVETVPYGCWRRATFDRIGYFDESLARNQDDEFNLRLIRSGGRIWQTPAAVSWYQPRANLRSLAWQYFQYGFWKVAVIRKHRLPASVRHLIPVLFVAGGIGLILGFCISALAGYSTASRWLAGMLELCFGTYVTAAVLASLAVAAGEWILLPVLPIVFLTYHVSYGTGFLLGLLRLALGGRPLPFARMLTGITR